jgi:hypothetical protein
MRQDTEDALRFYGGWAAIIAAGIGLFMLLVLAAGGA